MHKLVQKQFVSPQLTNSGKLKKTIELNNSERKLTFVPMGGISSQSLVMLQSFPKKSGGPNG